MTHTHGLIHTQKHMTHTSTHTQHSHAHTESWVQVSEQQQGEVSLGHSQSREEMEQLLASAASEEELSDTDVT